MERTQQEEAWRHMERCMVQYPSSAAFGAAGGGATQQLSHAPAQGRPREAMTMCSGSFPTAVLSRSSSTRLVCASVKRCLPPLSAPATPSPTAPGTVRTAYAPCRASTTSLIARIIAQGPPVHRRNSIWGQTEAQRGKVAFFFAVFDGLVSCILFCW